MRVTAALTLPSEPRRGLRRATGVPDPARGLGDREPVRAHAQAVQGDGLADPGLGFLDRRAGCGAAGQIGHASRMVAAGLLDHDGVLHRGPHVFRPACSKRLAFVPAAGSSLGLPGTAAP